MSELPVAVLSGIISHLPTREAVRTSILSKCWRNLWKGSAGKVQLSYGGHITIMCFSSTPKIIPMVDPTKVNTLHVMLGATYPIRETLDK